MWRREGRLRSWGPLTDTRKGHRVIKPLWQLQGAHHCRGARREREWGAEWVLQGEGCPGCDPPTPTGAQQARGAFSRAGMPTYILLQQHLAGGATRDTFQDSSLGAVCPWRGLDAPTPPSSLRSFQPRHLTPNSSSSASARGSSSKLS